MTNPKKIDDTLKAAEDSLRQANDYLGRNKARVEATEKIEDEKPNTLLQKVKDMALAARRINKVWDAAQDLYAKVHPWVGPVLKPVVWTAGKLKDLFVFAAFEHDAKGLKLDKDGDPQFAPMRLAKAFVIAAGLGASTLTGTSAAYFYGTQFTETIVTSGKENIEAGQLYEFTGCTSLPCSTQSDNGKYYHIEQSLLFPTLLRPEQDVYALIPKETAICELHGYGIYFKELKWLFKWTEAYQNVYDVACRPLTQAEIQESIHTGILPSVHTPNELHYVAPVTVTPTVSFEGLTP